MSRTNDEMKKIQEIYDKALALAIKDQQQKSISKMMLGPSGTTTGNVSGAPAPQNWGGTTPPPNATQQLLMQQMQYAGGNLTATELDKIFNEINLPHVAANHMEAMEKKEGFLWLDEEKTWSLVPFGSKPRINSANLKKRPETPGKFALMHRHDDDLMYEETALNARYHGDNYYICSHCHKPCPKEFVTLFVLQSTLSDVKAKA
jgi:hypothetical protein